MENSTKRMTMETKMNLIDLLMASLSQNNRKKIFTDYLRHMEKYRSNRYQEEINNVYNYLNGRNEYNSGN